MSTKESTSITPEEARRKAMEAVRFDLGTFLRIGDHTFDESEVEFVFPITLRAPKLILDGPQENAVDIRYLSQIEVGEIRIDGESGDIDKPLLKSVKKNVREYESELRDAVQKALVTSSGRQFAHLPFPENQFAPLEDILSQVILNDELLMSEIDIMDRNPDDDKYQSYVDDLVELNLLREKDDRYESGDILTTIMKKYDEHPDQVNAALGRYFESELANFEMVRRTLGPYLVIAGHYYMRALELEQMPTIPEKELRQAIWMEYSGKEAQEKEFKLSRYLIQLQRVGVLSPVYSRAERHWDGNDEIRANLEQQTEYLGEVAQIMSPSLQGQQTNLDSLGD